MTDCYAHLTPAQLRFPYSWVGHTPFAMWLVCAMRPRVFVELGTHTGNSYLSVCQSVKAHALPTRCYAIDTWQGDAHAQYYDDSVYQTLRNDHDAAYADFSTLMRMTFDQALSHFQDREIDLLHIDGLHTYQAVRHDFETWRPKLAANAVVLFHDTAVQSRDFGVHQYWQTLQQTYPYTYEFPHSNGLGVLCVGQPPQALAPLFDQSAHHLAARFINQGNQVAFNANFQDIEALLNAHEPQKQGLQSLFNYQVHLTNLAQLALAQIEQQLAQAQAEQTRLSQQSAQLQQQLAQAQAEQTRLSQQSAQLQQQLAQAQAEQTRLNEQNAQLSQALHQSQALSQAILGSNSWRLMAPLRYLGAKVKQSLPWRAARRGRYLLTKLIGLYGVSGAFLKAARYLKKHGPAPLLDKLRDESVAPAMSYHQWMQHTALPQRYHQADQCYAKWQAEPNVPRPRIAIVMPVYNVAFELLDAAIQSVLDQRYPEWQLCICNDASPVAGMAEFLDRYARQDPRIRVVHHSENGHISKASNAALALVDAEFVALLDNDDLLPPDALIWVVNEIIAHPDAQIIYSDEDKIGLNGELFEPYFKSDWNPELFLAHNLISHLGVYRTALLQKIGGFRQGYEGSQDYDLALRALLHIRPHQVRHIAKVLYHWRVLPGSTALSQDEKPYTVTAALKALNEYVRQKGLPGVVVNHQYGHYRLQYAPLQNPPGVTLIIPTKNAHALVKTCIDSVLQKTRYPNYDILLIDNASDDPESLAYFDTLRAHPAIRVQRDPRPFNYAALNNAAVAQTDSEYILLLNNDTEVIAPDWLTEMVCCALGERVGAVGAKLLYPDDTVQHGGVILGLGGVAGHAHHLLSRDDPGYFGKAMVTQEITAVTAACLLVKRDHYLAVGGLNEQHLAVAFNDVDFCLKLRQHGLRNIWTPYALLYHHESVSRGYEDTPQKQARFQSEVDYMKSQWADVIACDPFYNPNLSLIKPYRHRYLDEPTTAPNIA